MYYSFLACDGEIFEEPAPQGDKKPQNKRRRKGGKKRPKNGQLGESQLKRRRTNRRKERRQKKNENENEAE